LLNAHCVTRIPSSTAWKTSSLLQASGRASSKEVPIVILDLSQSEQVINLTASKVLPPPDDTEP
jgi:hypothetical protein